MRLWLVVLALLTVFTQGAPVAPNTRAADPADWQAGRHASALRSICSPCGLRPVVRTRIGEAANPGPAILSINDPEAFDEAGDDEEVTFESFITDGPPCEGVPACAPPLAPPGPHALVGPPALAGPCFAEAPKFRGARADMVFKKGVLGLGYYRDGMVIATPIDLVTLLRPPVGLPPIRLDLQVLVQGTLPVPGCGDCAGATAAPRTKPARRAPRHARRQPEHASGDRQPRCCPEPPDGPLAFDDVSHQKAGLWAIDTCNPNAWPAALDYLRVTAADFVVLQETKLRGEEACAAAEQVARSSGWSASILPCGRADAGGRSAGVAVAVRSHVGLSLPGPVALTQPTHQAGRFVMRRVGAICAGGLHLGSTYLTSSVGVSAKCNLDLLQSMACTLNGLVGPWCVGGDWNCTPEQLEATGWLGLVNGIVHAPTSPTCNGRIIDFFVVAAGFSHAVRSVHEVGDAGLTPHSPARLLLGAGPRMAMVRQLKAPRGFPAQLPLGPPNAPQAPQVEAPVCGDSLDEECSALICSIERELSAVAGHPPGLASQHAGRADGAKFVWRSACGPPASDKCRSSPISRAWRRIESWLRAITSAHTVDRADAARWKLLHHRLRLEVDDPALLQAKLQLLAWNTLLSETALRTPFWVGALTEAAAAKAVEAETAAARSANAAFGAWMREGPSDGLRRQHRLSRSATGWVPAVVTKDLENGGFDEGELDGLSPAQLAAVTMQPGPASSPIAAQQSANAERLRWGQEWAAGEPAQEPPWPPGPGPPPPAFTLADLKSALATFSPGAGLGWDDLHPRALLRLSDATLQRLVDGIQRCEAEGRWPTSAGLVIVVLLPKPDGGFRPIGLLPLIPRVWMKLRRDAARRWEAANARPYLYAGAAKGATVAAWKQAARAELTQALGVEYGQVLLDLVKAFERIPHHVLVREAVRLDYPLWLLRLSLATYKLERVLRVDRAMSERIVATRGITAGSGLATAEMRLVMIDIVDSALRCHPSVTPTLFVDDLSAESMAGTLHVLKHLVGFTRHVCRRVAADGMEVSATKSICTASSEKLGRGIADDLADCRIPFARMVKSLGTGLGAGRRRCAMVLNKRIKQFRKRISRFRGLRRAGVDTTRVLRTGGVAALTFGEIAAGVSPSMLLQQRRAVAAAAAPAAGTAGQHLDMALMLADGSAKGRVDPAFEAHAQPIGHWAQAVWNQWLPRSALLRLTADAKARLTRAAHPWQVVRGPAAAFVCSAARLNWTVHDALNVTTDRGRPLRLDLDSPAVIVRECHAAVRRWRWRAIEDAYHSLTSGGDGLGACFGPIWKLLRSREDSAVWNPGLRAALRSVVANRQWTQERCHKAGYVTHAKCLFCLHASPTTDHEPPSQQQLDEAPTGHHKHRIWCCPRLEPARAQLISPEIAAMASDCPLDDGALERALLPSAAAAVPAPAVLHTFTWTVCPPGGSFQGVVYTDGSRLDGPSPLLARNGWAFVVVDEAGLTIASASGVPPDWVDDIPGAEAWALVQAASHAQTGCTYRVDCEPCVKAFHRGRDWATSDRRPHARVHGLMFAALGDTDRGSVVWMPAHTSEDDVGIARLGDGSLLTAIDRAANAEADLLAKAAVELHRVPQQVRTEIRKRDELVTLTARLVARITYEAGHQTLPPQRDTDASRATAAAAARMRQQAAHEQLPRDVVVVAPRPLLLGGHALVAIVGGWTCLVCKARSKHWRLLAPGRCGGSAALRWATLAQTLAANGLHDGGGHSRVLSGDVLWCQRCGAYAEAKASCLAMPCTGTPVGRWVDGHARWRSHGRTWQLYCLRRGRHPRRPGALPAPVHEACWHSAGRGVPAPAPAAAFRVPRFQAAAPPAAAGSSADGRPRASPDGAAEPAAEPNRAVERLLALRERVRARERGAQARL